MSSADPVQRALVAVVRQALEAMALLDAVPGDRGSTQARLTESDGKSQPTWAWVKIDEPCPGTLALAIAPELALAIAKGAGAGSSDSELRDALGELTNIIAGRVVHALLGEEVIIRLGIPRTGRGAPDVRGAGWITQWFLVGERWLGVFVQGEGLVGRGSHSSGRSPSSVHLDRTVAAPSDYLTPPSRVASAPALTPALTPAKVPGDDSATGAWDALSVDVEGDGAMPAQIGNYRILGKLGEGGMGVVYKAHHATLNRPVAIKVLKAEFASNQQFVARFLREARSAAIIDHPNVVTVYDASMQDGLLYIVLRYVQGGDLATLIHEQGRLSEDKVLPIIAQCLFGLNAINANGMVHRDIKPANILLDADATPRLADLGLARSVEADDGLSKPGAGQGGTPSYMSPEQARGQAVDIRSDIYSLGVTMYAALCGQPPFSGGSAYDVVASVLHEEPPDLRQRNPAVTADVAAVVMKAIAKKAEDRYQDPMEFFAAIEVIMRARGIDMGGSSSSRRAESTRIYAVGKAASDPQSTEKKKGTGWLQKLLTSRKERSGDK
ncbi:MAG: protein kinase [Planctomycetes bacterium]|nr:protein kinase [Planctomycetota bacterium]